MQYSNQKPRYCSLGGSLISAIISISCLIILIWLLWFRIPYTFGRQSPTSPPLARVRNGTYIGRHLDKFNQDVFLGMPYAQPPIGQNRFHPPRPIVNVWEHPRSAHEYGPHCIGYGVRRYITRYHLEPRANVILGSSRTVSTIGRLSHPECHSPGGIRTTPIASRGIHIRWGTPWGRI